ncbi:hypothetical protein [Actinokineospora bangkokensis]|uniref:Uncharacterized protein n=1 Tax=Actinokineospora bangkokensis TaxID=1193682 RepID=A0A1Q9LKZ4_9PSEU|nr:hypothetical protein [Actinokineospora bangkokensis]OLR92673.1 hypothetical protein BJP25_21850 [Actinokineospora bangkokensis]
MSDDDKVGNRRAFLLIFIISAGCSFVSLVWYAPFVYAIVGSIAGGLLLVLSMLVIGAFSRNKR